jgi:hypothetical protein
MSRNRVALNVPGFRNFVNIGVVALANVLIVAGYFAALGRLAGIA